jgi:pimeloyl-ACP methyl ester carboxylesterase
MENYRLRGLKPYKLITLHGGPGALGELNNLSKVLSKEHGVIEHLQTRDTINLLIDDIKNIINKKATVPVTIIGYSWGAWLAILFTAKYQELVEKIILVSSGPFEEEYSRNIMGKRISRFNGKEKKDFIDLSKMFSDSNKISDEDFKEFISLIEKADSYKLIKRKNDELDFHHDLYKKIWKEASNLRKKKVLIKSLEIINSKIKVIHGNYDPHPVNGVIKPLNKMNKKYEFKLLEKCGHIPWKEEYAKDEFYNVLKKMINN